MAAAATENGWVAVVGLVISRRRRSRLAMAHHESHSQCASTEKVPLIRPD
jgi:hypothetical protein